MNDRIKRLDPFRLEVPRDYKPGMNTSGIIYVDEGLESILEKESIEQVANVTTLPGIVGQSIAMSDIHTGYGFPIGGVAGFDVDEGIISPGGVGYDINCGIRLLKTPLMKKDIKDKIEDLIIRLYHEIPTGVGSKSRLKLSQKDEEKVLVEGARWAVKKGFGDLSDLQYTESEGCLEGVDPSRISKKAYDRGHNQLGTLGSGNHFLEIQEIVEVYEPKIADVFGLFEGQITVMIHTGSRGLGHQICTDFIEVMRRASKKYNIPLPDRELVSAPFKSQEGQDYFNAMKAAANFAWANRQIITHWTRQVFYETLRLPPSRLHLDILFDVAHNIAKVERHIVDGKKRQLIIHRKGATRAFSPHHPELPERYKETGQPVIIPGDMGRASYVLVGTEQAMRDTFGSTCHGAGRRLSRNQAIRDAKGRSIATELSQRGVIVMASGKETLAEEMPDAYKDVSQVVNVVDNANISKKVVKMRPLGVIKG
ncbi:MAG: RtcB family protein [Thermodesulfovibrionales bacterium]|nr:RtcB family protein [Thermodesulfovibrionales bacterium]